MMDFCPVVVTLALPKFQRLIEFAAFAAVAAALAGCSGAFNPQSVATDDDALCRYGAGAAETPAYRQCRVRLDKQRAQQSLASATLIETPRPNAVALVRTPTNVAACTEQNKTACPEPADVTGTIPAQPKNAPKP